jgi:hypothetical protein
MKGVTLIFLISGHKIIFLEVMKLASIKILRESQFYMWD